MLTHQSIRDNVRTNTVAIIQFFLRNWANPINQYYKKVKQLWTSSKFYNFINETFTLTNLVQVRLFCLNMRFQYKCLKWNWKPYFNDDIHYEEQQTDELYPFSDPTWNADPIATETNVWGQGQRGWVFKECQDVQHKYKDVAASGVKIKIVFLQRSPEKSWMQIIVFHFLT